MQKDNIFKSSEFHMDEGDILHMIIRDETGNTINWMLIGTEEGTEVVPNAPVAKEATSITSSSFVANWSFMENSTGYYLDVHTNPLFPEDDPSDPFVIENLNVGDVITYTVTGLNDATTYYYRLRAYNDNGTSVDSNVITTVTALESIVDKDGNAYTYVNIGTQQWMVENLKTTKYADGTSIPNLTANGFDDWFLPSKDEAWEIRKELYLYGVGSLGATWFWTSSEYNATYAYRLLMTTGQNDYDYKNNSNTYSIRPIRAFISTTVYALRDIGPAGGYIFYKSGNNYLEAAPSNILPVAWSNITNQAIGTTGTAIGTGQDNTTAIIGQAEHTSSAAKLCDDLNAGGWSSDVTGAYCWYDNDIANKDTYGALYNWYAVDNAHGLAPTGWRIPSQTDLVTLNTFLGGESVAGGKLKEVGLMHWDSPNTGATDKYGFKMVPGGTRTATGLFVGMNTSNYFYTSTESGGNIVTSLAQSSNSANYVNVYTKRNGFSVRCVRNI